MKSYTAFLKESTDVVAHLEHAEDFVLNGGVDGTRKVIDYMIGMRETLLGHVSGRINATVKYDGAPSIFAGTDPTDGKFFVAKKGIFNKTPKVYKTPEEIHADTSGDLANKLELALKYLPKLGIKGIIQGDFMFSQSDMKKQTIDGQSYLTFQPNTIVYAIPLGSDLAKRMMRAKIGVVWHTRYSGNSFQTLKAQGGTEIAKTLHQSNDVWFDDVVIKDLSGTASFNAKESQELTAILSRAGKLFSSIPADVLNGISSNPDTLLLVKTFNNSKIRAGSQIGNPSAHVREMFNWIYDRFEVEKAKKKSQSGKESVDQKMKETMAYFSKTAPSDLIKVFELMNIIIEAKDYLLSKLNQIGSLRTFLKTTDGYQVTGQEGYVITDHLGKNAMKLVDRLEFSRANFSPQFIKGWQR